MELSFHLPSPGSLCHELQRPEGSNPEGSILGTPLSSAQVPAGATPTQHALLCREPGKERVQEGLGERDPLGGVEFQHPPHQVKELRVLQRVVQHVGLKGTGDTQHGDREPGPRAGAGLPPLPNTASPIPNTAPQSSLQSQIQHPPGLPPIPNTASTASPISQGTHEPWAKAASNPKYSIPQSCLHSQIQHPSFPTPPPAPARAGSLQLRAVPVGFPIPEQLLPSGVCSSPGRICHQTCSHPTPGCHCGSIFASCGEGGVSGRISPSQAVRPGLSSGPGSYRVL